MPPAPKRACSTQGCPNVTTNRGPCDDCTKQRHRDYQKIRDDGNEFYRSPRWRRIRRQCLQRDPCCVECLAEGRVRPSTIADHIKSRRQFPDLAYELSNLRGICKPHHDSRTARDNSATLFGRRFKDEQ